MHQVTAGGLYTGQHWNRAAAAAARAGAELWIISAGLGFLHASDWVVPYDATFASMLCCHRTVWERLTTRPPTVRRCPSLRALMRDRPHDRFIVARVARVPAGSGGRSLCGQGGAGLTAAAGNRQFKRLPGTSARKPDPHQCGHDEDAEHQHDGAEYQPGRDAAGTLSGRRN